MQREVIRADVDRMGMAIGCPSATWSSRAAAGLETHPTNVSITLHVAALGA